MGLAPIVMLMGFLERVAPVLVVVVRGALAAADEAVGAEGGVGVETEEVESEFTGRDDDGMEEETVETAS